MAISEETRLKKAHIALMKHKETALYSGVIMMGKSVVIDDKITAYTDGINKKYGRQFISKLTDAELRALILHENLHVALKHIPRFKKEFKDNAHLTNVATDYVVNDVIVSLTDKELCKLPEGGLYDAKYHNWSVREVYNDLKKQQDENKQSGGGDKINDLESLDEHDFANAQEMTSEEIKKMSDKIDKALREGNILAGRMGVKTPRVIDDLFKPRVDWKAELREFITSTTRGTDEYTWRKFNKRMVANDLYLPSLENETIGEIVVAIDTSGSIGSKELTEFATELSAICEVCNPNRVRVLWWDTQVHSEQIFENTYNDIAKLLKPEGGGGTHVSCVSEYLNANKVQVDGVLVFSDGYVEHDIKWDIASPTMWLITENSNFTAPVGKVIRKED